MGQKIIPIIMPYRYRGGFKTGALLSSLNHNIYPLRFISALQKRKMHAWFRQYGEIPLFTHIQIETVSRCNNDCSFCPANIYRDKREFGIMDDDLYTKILEDLKDLNYQGLLSLFNNNEPLIDKKIVERIRLARKCCLMHI